MFEKPADSIKSTLYNYFVAYILVTGDAKVNEIIKMLHLKLVHRFLYETQKIFYWWSKDVFKTFLLMKQIIFSLNACVQFDGI